MKRALVTYSIEKSLIDMGGERLLDKVAVLLNEDHGIGISECYLYPQYLHSVLSGLYGRCANEIIKSIKSNLEEFEHQEQIGRFIEVMRTE